MLSERQRISNRPVGNRISYEMRIWYDILLLHLNFRHNLTKKWIFLFIRISNLSRIRNRVDI